MPKFAVEIRPFIVPNFVVEHKDNAKEIDLGKWHISELDADTLSELCDQFRADVFRKAERFDPRAK